MIHTLVEDKFVYLGIIRRNAIYFLLDTHLIRYVHFELLIVFSNITIPSSYSGINEMLFSRKIEKAITVKA